MESEGKMTMDKLKNERTLWQAFTVTRALAAMTEAMLINPDDADSHMLEYHAKLQAAIGDFRPSAIYELAEDLDKMHSEHLFSREAKERKERHDD